MENKTNYYSILPAKVRYDKELCANDKLIYSEITALLNDSGHCFVSLKYFAELFRISKTSVLKCINNLENGGFIYTIKELDPITKKVISFYIELN